MVNDEFYVITKINSLSMVSNMSLKVVAENQCIKLVEQNGSSDKIKCEINFRSSTNTLKVIFWLLTSKSNKFNLRNTTSGNILNLLFTMFKP